MHGAVSRLERVLAHALFLASRDAPIRARNEVILDSEAIVVNELPELDLAGDSEIEERVRLDARLERLCVLVIAVHVFVLELVRIVLLVSLVLELGIVAAHVVDISEGVVVRSSGLSHW